MKLIKLDAENLPEAGLLCWIKRTNNKIYFGARINKPLSTNIDNSKDCWWYANPVTGFIETDCRDEWHAHNHFSDVTVIEWQYVTTPEDSEQAPSDAVEFAEWILRNPYDLSNIEEGKWVDCKDSYREITTTKLYEIFKKSKT